MFDLSQIDVKTSIGKTGFEPATPWSQTKYSTKLSYFPLYASGRIRTYNRLIRSQVLYPVEPRLQITLYKQLVRILVSERRDSNSRPQPWQGCVLPLTYVRT